MATAQCIRGFTNTCNASPRDGYLCFKNSFYTVTNDALENGFVQISLCPGIIIFLEQIPTHQWIELCRGHV